MLQRLGGLPPEREVKFARADLTRVEADGAFSGYASIFGKVDLGRDIVMPGAFAESLAKRGVNGIKLLFQHDPNEPIGVWETIREDGKGLWVKGRLMTEVARAREVLSLMRAGALDGLSIGFRTVEGRKDPTSGVRRLHKIDLWEISVVTFPMLPEARVDAVKRRLNILKRDAGGKPVPTFPHPAPGEGATPFEAQEYEKASSELGAFLHSGFKALADRLHAAGGGNSTRLTGAIRRAAASLHSDP